MDVTGGHEVQHESADTDQGMKIGSVALCSMLSQCVWHASVSRPPRLTIGQGRGSSWRLKGSTLMIHSTEERSVSLAIVDQRPKISLVDGMRSE
jgi:hypothetical protein